LLLILLIGSGQYLQTAQAAATCAVTYVNNTFAGISGNAVVTPESFATLQNGERVAAQRNIEVYYTCNVSGTTELGVGLNPVPSVFLAPGFSDIYTTAGMQSLGLGFKADVYTLNNGDFSEGPDRPITNSGPIPFTSAKPPVEWYPTPSGERLAILIARFYLYKIGPITDTGGAVQTINVYTDLFNSYIAEKSAPTVPLAAYAANHTFTSFRSRVRACTPTVSMNRTVTFSAITTDLPASGSTADAQEFTLTWNCPYMAYTTTGFRVEPVYGVEDAANGVYRLAPGSGSAKGVGIQLLGQGLRNAWGTAHPPGWQPVVPNAEYSFAVLDLDPMDLNTVDSLNAEKPVSQTFRAQLYRLNGPFEAGTTKSAVRIIMQYR